MELKGSTFVQQPIAMVWAALNNEDVLRQCITGCESLERVDDHSLNARVAIKIGPVRARFNGKVSMSEVLPLQGYTLHFEGSGGAAGFAKGSSLVALHAENGGTRIDYSTQASIGGKLGQVGGRMIDATARSMADEFFTAFSACLGTSGASGAAVTNEAASPDASPASPAAAAGAGSLAHAHDASGAKPDAANVIASTHVVTGPATQAAGSDGKLAWFIAGMIVSALLMLMGKHLL